MSAALYHPARGVGRRAWKAVVGLPACRSPSAGASNPDSRAAPGIPQRYSVRNSRRTAPEGIHIPDTISEGTMKRLLIALSLATLGFAAAPTARACGEYCEEYLEHLEERAEERAYAREEAMENAEDEGYVARRRPRRQAKPSASKVSAAKRARRTGGDTEDDAEPKTSATSDSKSEVATAGGCKQYFPAVGMSLTVPCK
jgi:hypothetical protein